MSVTPEHIRTALRALSNNRPVPVSTATLADHLGLTEADEKKRLSSILSEMNQRDEIERTGRGEYRITALKTPPLKTVMWRLLRMRRTVTIEELMELSGAASSYAEEWLRLLQNRQIVRRTGPGKYRLIDDTASEPATTDAAKRMKKMKDARRSALAALDAASQAIAEAKKYLEDRD